jgi:pimeloyl-ACP methyl ester carboxylesterase
VLHTEIDEGADDDLTLVYVHGYALNLDCWHFQRLHFRGQLRQVFYDLRSHGRSTRSEAERCRIPQLAEDLYQVLEEVVGTGPVILIGHSMGAMTIMRLAQSPRAVRQSGAGRGTLHVGRVDGPLADPRHSRPHLPPSR